MKYFNAVHCKDIINMGYILSDFGLREFSSRTYIYRERELTVKTDIPVSQVDDKKNIIKTKSKARSFTVKWSWNKEKEKPKRKVKKHVPLRTETKKQTKQVSLCAHMYIPLQYLSNLAKCRLSAFRNVTDIFWMALFIYIFLVTRQTFSDRFFIFIFLLSLLRWRGDHVNVLTVDNPTLQPEGLSAFVFVQGK